MMSEQEWNTFSTRTVPNCSLDLAFVIKNVALASPRYILESRLSVTHDCRISS